MSPIAQAMILLLAPVAGALEFHVAIDGSDANPGTANTPFATLHRARDAVRAAKPLTEPVNIIVHAGTYYLEKTLELGPEDSGTAIYPITYRAAEGERVVLSGGRVVQGPWKVGGEHCWVTDLENVALPCPRDRAESYAAAPASWHFRQMFVDGQRATRARFPNADAEDPFLYARGGAHDHIQCYPGEVRTAWAEAPDAQVNIVAGWRFFNQWNDIVGVDTQKNVLQLGERERHAAIKKDNWFWVEGVRDELDQPGEWYLDVQEGRLYYWPLDEGDPNDSTIIAPHLNRLVYLKGDVNAGTHVEHVVFRGLEFKHTTYTLGHIEARVHTDAAIKLNNARHCRVEDCRFENIGGYALWLHLDSTDNLIARNTVTQSGGGGVLLTGARLSYMDDTKVYTPGPAAAAVAPLRNRIERNEAGHCGLIRYYGGGVHLDSRPAETAMMQGNIITNNYFHDLSRNGIFAFRNQGGNLIAYNRIDNAMLTTLDGGGIHMATMNKLASPTYCIGNVISNIWGMDRTRSGQGTRHIARGIFLDWFTSSIVMRDNLTYNTWQGGYCLLGGNDNQFVNNVIIKDPEGLSLSPKWAGSRGTGNQTEHNIVDSSGDKRLCVDVEAGDFRLRPDAAYPEGFSVFDTTQAGLTGTVSAGIAADQLISTGEVLHYTDSDVVERNGAWADKEATGLSGLFTFRFLQANPDTGATVTFRLPIAEGGQYDIYANFPEGKNLSKDTPVEVHHADGVSHLTINQSQSGNWPKLGHWRFEKGGESRIVVSTEGAGGPVVVDSVGFVKRGS
ncbi:MAG: right-handed parallel beta-helix repeat-containing protein [Candidatus Hydrogenedentota bacterium]